LAAKHKDLTSQSLQVKGSTGRLARAQKVLETGRKTWKQLMQQTGISGATFSRTLNIMIHRGEVKFEPDKFDRRITYYFLADKEATRKERRKDEFAQYLLDRQYLVSHVYPTREQEKPGEFWFFGLTPEKKNISAKELAEVKKKTCKDFKTYVFQHGKGLKLMMKQHKVREVTLTIKITQQFS